MKVSIRRSGGFAGITKTAMLDSAALPSAEAAEIEELAKQALASSSHAANAADAFQYDVTIDGRTVTWSDAAMPDAARALVRRVMRS